MNTRARTAFEHILPDKKIRLNPYSLMRDPLEAQHWPEPSVSLGSPGEEPPEDGELARYGVVVAAKAAARLLSLTATQTITGRTSNRSAADTPTPAYGNSTAMITTGSAWRLTASDFSQLYKRTDRWRPDHGAAGAVCASAISGQPSARAFEGHVGRSIQCCRR